MDKRNLILAVLVGMALTWSCGSPEKKPQQQPVGAPADTQPQAPSVTGQAPTPPATAQTPTPQASVQAPTPPTVVFLKGNPTGPVKFKHAKHAKLADIKCDLCHHASRPEKPSTSTYQKCQNCHTTVAVAPMKTKAQAAFHDPLAKKGLCVDCHLKRLAAGKKAPANACLICHRKEYIGAADGQS